MTQEQEANHVRWNLTQSRLYKHCPKNELRCAVEANRGRLDFHILHRIEWISIDSRTVFGRELRMTGQWSRGRLRFMGDQAVSGVFSPTRLSALWRHSQL